MPEETTTITMTRDEALVLFEFLHRLDAEDTYPIPAERLLVWNLICLLECQLVETFHHDYRTIVEEARRRLGAEFEPDDHDKA